ncbi:immunoglobulin domain-containing protein [Opitutales bacterium]|nr:immunoglobulin domain-containing protein [Opitutales bacterium]
MKFIQSFLLLSFLFTFSLWSATPVPYSGKIDIRGVNYFGEAQFVFSLHDGNGTTHWINGKQLGETIKVTIRNGRYTVLLGGQGMNSLPPELFLNHDELYLKVEFDNEDGKGLRHLAPDQLITATPRALVAELAKVAKVAEKVGNGAITREMLSQEVLSQLDANGSSTSFGPITRDMLPQDVRDDLNKTVTITRNMLPADVLADLNKSSTTASPITLSMLAPEVTAKLDQNGSGGNTTVNNPPAVGSLIALPYGQNAPAGYSLYQRGEPKTLVWEEKAPVSVARYAFDGVEVLNGKIYFLGGYNGSNVNTVERYDPLHNSWETLNSISLTLSGFGSAILNDRIWLIGGWDLSNNFQTVNVIDPTNLTLTNGLSLPLSLRASTAISIDDKIFLIGGYANQTSDSVLCYDSISNSWNFKSSMPTARYNTKLVLFENKIWAIGGKTLESSIFHTTVESYDYVSNSWQTEASLNTPRYSPTAWVANGKIYVAGGSNGSNSLQSIELYDPLKKQWSFAGNLPVNIGVADAVVLDDTVYVIAGSTASGVYSNKVYAADLNASVVGVYDLYRKDGNASAGTPLVQGEVADGSVTASKIASKTIGKDQISDSILKYLKPEITVHPQAQTVYADTNASFSVTAEGKYLSYQWKKDGSNVTSETNATFAITDANSTQHDGNYSVVVSNDFGSVESNKVEVKISDALLNGLVGWWKFDETNGTLAIDSSVNGYHGNLFNGPTWSTGKIGGALSFDGVDDRVNLPHNTLNGQIDVTVSFWFLESQNNTDHHHFISAASTTQSNRFLLGVNSDGEFNYNDNDSSDIKRIVYQYSESLTNWSHIVLTRSISGAKLFIEGSLKTNESFANTHFNIAQNGLWIGGDQDSVGGGWSTTQQLNGLLDDLRIYDRALSAAEVKALYNLGQ